MPKVFSLKFKSVVGIEKNSIVDVIEVEELVSIETVIRQKPEIKKEFLEEKDLLLPLDAQWFISRAKEGFNQGVLPAEAYKKHMKWIKENIELIKEKEEDSYKPFDQLVYILRCNYYNKVYEAYGKGDFSVALDNFLKQFQDAILKICACCSLSDHRSYGDEDLRHGWFCFRDLNVSMDTIWYEREEEFAKAIRNVM